MPSEVASRAARAIQERVFPGCVIGVVSRSGERNVMSFGHFTYDDAQLVNEDTIYDLASVTKSIPIASLVAIFTDEGKFKLTDSVREYIPELQNDYGATIEDLLTYRVRGVQLSTIRNTTSEEILTHVFETGFEGPPGEHAYTNLPAFLLGVILERVAKQTLPALADGYFFAPLAMQDTTFFPMSGFTKSRYIAPTEISEDGKDIRGIVHDESARVFALAHRVVGHAGVFSTAPDMLSFLGALLQKKYGFTKSIIEGAERGLGWQLDQPWFMGKLAGQHAFGKTGFTGTSVICDVDRGIAFVILSNRTYPKRPPDSTSRYSAINAFRADIADIVFR